MSTLYELTDEWRQVAAMAQDPEIDEQTIADTLESIAGEIQEKADGYAKVIEDFKAQAAALKVQEERMKKRREVFESRAAYLKQKLFDAMKETKNEKFDTGLFSFSIRKNPASLKMTDGAKYPEKYLIAQEPKPDRKAMIDAIKGGEKIEGFWIEQAERLDIK